MSEDEPQTPLVSPSPTLLNEDNKGNPQTYVAMRLELINRAMTGDLPKSVDGERLKKWIAEECEANTGVPYTDAAQENRDHIASLMELMERGEDELNNLADAILACPDSRLTDDLKKKYVKSIRATIHLQRLSRENPIAFMLYIGRDDDPEHAGEMFTLAQCHVDMHEIWADEEKQHSLIQAPPGHGKSTCLRYRMSYEIGQNPALRHLYLTDQAEKAAQTGLTIKRILRSRRFRAVFPDVRLLGRADEATDSGTRFTIARKNSFARDATFFCAAIKSRIQGNRFDRLWPDDLCPAEVRDYPSERRNANQKWDTEVKTRMADPKTARIRMICTPWHPDDVAGRIAREAAAGHQPDWRIEIDRFRIKDDKDGSPIPIWPGKWDAPYFEQYRSTNPIDYDLLYRLKSNVETKRSVNVVRYYNSQINGAATTDADRRGAEAIEIGERTLSIDPTASSNEQSTDTGISEAVLAKNATGQEFAFITEAWMFHKGPVEIQDWIVDRVCLQADVGRPYTTVLIEAQGGIKGMVSLWVSNITQKLKERKCPSIPTFITPGTRLGAGTQNKSKLKRLIECAGYLESGVVRFAGRRTWDKAARIGRLEAIPGSPIERLAEHILTFDGTNRSDGVDATTQWILFNQSRMSNPNVKAEPAPQEPKKLDRMAEAVRRAIESVLNPKDDNGFEEEAEFWRERMTG